MKSAFIFFLICFPLAVIAQQVDSLKDSVSTNQLEEVTVTGESKVMSLSKKLFAVGVIDQKDIATVAGNNLADILNYNLNISVNPDPTTGRSTISMFGLDGQYVKILLDGIPMASDNGMGNNIDITQINLEDVERIEIVEGSNGVLYGDNAVAGVINIVTKTGLEGYKWALRAAVQEETVGNEYALFDRGRHIQNIKVDHQLTKKLSLSAGASRNDFAGFYNGYQGKNYVNIEDDLVVNDGLRGTEWNPKEQLTLFGNSRLALEKHNIFYKFQYYTDDIYIYNHEVNGRQNSSGEANPTATDKYYNTKRWVNNLNASGAFIGASQYNVSFSLQNQKRYFQQYTYNIRQQGIEAYTIDELSQSSDILYSKGFVSNILPKPDMLNLQLGYEFTNQQGFDATATGAYSTDVVENTLENYDFFGVLDIYLTDKFALYPGGRFTNNSQFGNKFIWGLSSTYAIDASLKAKAVLGSAFRAPNFEELFFYFVDSNHNVQGNPDLNPEDGISVFLHLEKKWALRDIGLLKSSIKSYYFDINDKITFAVASEEEEDENLQFSYYNVDASKILGFAWENSLKYNNWQANLGLNYIGEASSLYTPENGKDYLWSFNLQSSISKYFPSIKTYVSALLKHNGRSLVYMEQDDEVTTKKTNAFTWLDASARTQLTNNLELTLGVRNIMDIVTVGTSDVSTGTHSATTSNTQLFGNGRSYFLKLLYQLNLN